MAVTRGRVCAEKFLSQSLARRRSSIVSKQCFSEPCVSKGRNVQWLPLWHSSLLPADLRDLRRSLSTAWQLYRFLPFQELRRAITNGGLLRQFREGFRAIAHSRATTVSQTIRLLLPPQHPFAPKSHAESAMMEELLSEPNRKVNLSCLTRRSEDCRSFISIALSRQ